MSEMCSWRWIFQCMTRQRAVESVFKLQRAQTTQVQRAATSLYHAIMTTSLPNMSTGFLSSEVLVRNLRVLARYEKTAGMSKRAGSGGIATVTEGLCAGY